MTPPSPLCYLSVDKAVTRQPPKLSIWLLASLWWLAHFVCCFIFETGAQGASQNSLELTNLCLTLLSVEVTRVCHHSWLGVFILCLFYFYFIIMMQICRSGSYPHVCGQYIILTAKWFACHCVRNVHKSSSPLPVSNYTGSYQPVLTSPSISQCTVNDCPGSRSVCSCGLLKRLPAFGVARSKFNLWFGADP